MLTERDKAKVREHFQKYYPDGKINTGLCPSDIFDEYVIHDINQAKDPAKAFRDVIEKGIKQADEEGRTEICQASYFFSQDYFGKEYTPDKFADVENYARSLLTVDIEPYINDCKEALRGKLCAEVYGDKKTVNPELLAEMVYAAEHFLAAAISRHLQISQERSSPSLPAMITTILPITSRKSSKIGQMGT